MPDISICTNKACPSKEYCYRFTAKPSEFRQSYADFTCEEDEINCSHFYPNGKNSTKCKLDGVKRDGEMCNKPECLYPKCVQDDYCIYCYQSNGVHKMGCETRKVTIINMMKDDEKLGLYYDQMDKEVHFNRGNLNK